jgi:DNA ligase-1
VFSCQLAKNGNDHPKKLKGPKLLDIKLDGVRLLTLVDIDKKEVVQYTRNGLINDNFPHIRKMFEVFIPLLKESMVFDGEIVSQNFQEMMTQLNRKSNLNTTDAKLALFDIIPWASFKAGVWKVSQVDRHDALCAFEGVFSRKMGDTVYIIPKLAVDLDTEAGQKAFREFNNDAVKAGFEGIMIKDPNAYYVTDRTDSWLKIKPKITVDLTVTGFEPGKVGGENEHSLGGMICEGVEDGKNIKVVVGNGYSDELRNDIWNNKSKVKGRIVEVEGDVITKSRDSDTWSLRFPVFARFRGWKPGEKL